MSAAFSMAPSVNHFLAPRHLPSGIRDAVIEVNHATRQHPCTRTTPTRDEIRMSCVHQCSTNCTYQSYGGVCPSPKPVDAASKKTPFPSNTQQHQATTSKQETPAATTIKNTRTRHTTSSFVGCVASSHTTNRSESHRSLLLVCSKKGGSSPAPKTTTATNNNNPLPCPSLLACLVSSQSY